MPSTWTTEQVAALAPEAKALATARGLANRRKWQALGRSERAAWGLCQGSAAEPYRAQLDLAGPAYACTCPSHKHPCKHTLGLFLLFAGQPGDFAADAPPAWVAEWLAKRDARATQQTARADAPPKPVDAAAQAKRVAAREDKVAAGLAELETWLGDVAHQGLAALAEKDYAFYDRLAARLIDAQAPGLARQVRALAGAAGTPGWQEQALGRLGRLWLLTQACRRQEALPPDLQAEVRGLVGWTHDQDAVLAGPGVRDRWLVVGQYVEDDERLATQRTWLWGETTRRPALVLAFSVAGRPFDSGLAPASVADAELAFFPGAWPLRALVKQRFGATPGYARIPGHATISAALTARAAALAAQPWLISFPAPLCDVAPTRDGDHWWLRDREDALLPLVCPKDEGWDLLAVSAGRPLDVFGELTAAGLWPLHGTAPGVPNF